MEVVEAVVEAVTAAVVETVMAAMVEAGAAAIVEAGAAAVEVGAAAMVEAGAAAVEVGAAAVEVAAAAAVGNKPSGWDTKAMPSLEKENSIILYRFLLDQRLEFISVFISVRCSFKRSCSLWLSKRDVREKIEEECYASPLFSLSHFSTMCACS